VNDVVLGAGALAGRGVYAARDFAPGEVVIVYALSALDEAAYLALPAGEELFVHSYGGRRFLYPAPARFVNHADDPSCYQDFDRGCDIARRPISRGEPITIDAGEETARELSTFLLAYGRAAHTPAALAELIAADATLWLSGHPHHGRDAVVAALIAAPPGPLSDVEWRIGTGRWEALCSATLPGARHLTMLLKVITGNWQIIYLHA
jgi:hypothetical protein